MNMHSVRQPGNSAARKSRVGFFLVAALMAGATAAHAQQNDPARQRPVVPTSELGRDNLSRVAASAADIKTILVKDAGLMVELKRWVAKDATSQGQIISDTDLA